MLFARGCHRLGGRWRWSSCLFVVLLLVIVRRRLLDEDAQSDVGGHRSRLGRSLLWMDEYSYIDFYQDSNSSNSSSSNSSDCNKPLHSHRGFNNSCEYVRSQCGDVPVLFDYLALPACHMPHLKWLAYLILILWLLILISLLATTADYFFVPPLNVLAAKLNLSPAIAGITLLAIGNGAPDVFTAYASIQRADDFPLQLSALLGASIFISTVVLGSVMLVAEVSTNTIKRVDILRDIIVYMIVVATVIGVSYDGKIYLGESAAFLGIYICYIAVVVILERIQKRAREAAKQLRMSPDESDDRLSEHAPLVQSKSQTVNRSSTVSLKSSGPSNTTGPEEDEEEEEDPNEIPGLTWPSKGHIGLKIQFVIEYPFSILRWISIPPCETRWNKWRRYLFVSFPLPAAMIMLIAAESWDGFTLPVGGLQQYSLWLILGPAMSVGLFVWTHFVTEMSGFLQAFSALFAFILSIAWLNIEANEVVAVLESLGLVLGIDTAILGLTVLAIGNSVGDLVADTTVAKRTPAMGVSSCFGSPLLNDVLGLGISLTAYTASHYPHPFTFDINSSNFNKVKLSWIFLGVSLIMTACVFPGFRFSPPRQYAFVLWMLYVLFMVMSILDELKIVTLPSH